MVTAWKPILAAIVIFVAGVLTGSFTIDLTTPKPARAFPRDFSAGSGFYFLKPYDINFQEVEKGTKDFLNKTKSNYKILKEVKTVNNHCHPSFWNGIMILKKL